jgi:HK97 gp10 family phage protein
MRIEGGAKLAATLRSLPDRVNRSVQREALREAGELIRARASAMAPRAPGAPDLADNIGISNARPEDGAVAIAIGPTKGFFYGYFQEFGTSRHGAQSFMRPAFDGEGGRGLKVIMASLWSALVRRGFGSTRGSGGGVGL